MLRCTGEEVVTKESFVSICWRLIPYWLNNWEQQWGAECSSMMFELPHFAVELLVVLPCVQVRLNAPCTAYRLEANTCCMVLFGAWHESVPIAFSIWSQARFTTFSFLHMVILYASMPCQHPVGWS